MEIVVDCPYCGEPVELSIDPTGGDTQHYVEDCAVCCQPIDVVVDVTSGGECSVSAKRGDD
jgi:hypothetical protein